MNQTTVVILGQDEEISRRIIRVLTANSLTAIVAENIDSIFNLVETRIVSLIIFQLNSLTSASYKLIEKLQKNSLTSNLPIIAISKEFNGQIWRKLMTIGVDDCLDTSFTHQDLSGAIATRLNKRARLQTYYRQELEELRQNITSALPHELRTALTGILVSIDFLIDNSQSVDYSIILEIFNCIRQSSQRLKRLIDNFICYTQLQLVDNSREELYPTDQTKTVAEAITEIVTAESNNQTKANIQIKADNNLLPIESQYFQKIVQELLNNALKFSAPDSLIRLNSKIKNNNLYFIISDHGRGMTAQQIAKIGAHTQFARNIYEQQGSGLGLAITKEIVNLYQGELAIKSILNEGTIIKIVIPLSTSDQHNCLRQKQAKVSKITQA